MSTSQQLRRLPCALQVKSIFGYSTRPNPANTPTKTLPPISFPRHNPVQEQLGDLFGSTWTPYFQWRELVMGLSWIALLLVMKHIGNSSRYGSTLPSLLSRFSVLSTQNANLSPKP